MANNRIQRINADIQRELTALLRSVKDPRISNALTSVVRVDTTSDLRYCRVYISTLGDAKEAMAGLRSAAGYLRRELGSAMTLRYTPELQFVADNSIERGVNMVSMIERVIEEDENR